MKRLLIGGLAVGSLLFAATGVASANTSTTVVGAPVSTDLANPAITSDAWPLVPSPGTLQVSFDSPSLSKKINGYTVSCTAPALASDGSALVTPLPPIAATFAVNPADGTSADADMSIASGRVTLTVGPYSVAVADELPPLTCTLIASNAFGVTKPIKLNKAPGTSLPPSGTCAYDATSDGLGNGLLAIMGGSHGPSHVFDPILGVSASGLPNHKEPIAPVTTNGANPATFTQTASNFDVVIADLTALGGGPTPFCSTNVQYNEHVLSDQPVTFASSGLRVPAVTSGTKQHPKQVTLSNVGLTASVKAGIPLNVSSSDTVYVFDSTHFSLDSCTGGTTCTITSAAQPSLGLPAAPTGASYVIVHDALSHLIAPGKPIVGAKIKLTVSKRVFLQVAAVACDKWVGPASAGCVPVTAVAGPYPAAFGLTLATAVTTITVSTAPLPITLVAPGSFIFAASGGAAGHGGDTNYLSHVVEAASTDL